MCGIRIARWFATRQTERAQRGLQRFDLLPCGSNFFSQSSCVRWRRWRAVGHERGGQNSAKTERVKWAKEISKPPQATSSSSSNLFSIHFSTFSLLSLSLSPSFYLFIYSFFFLKKFLIIFNRVESVVFRINFSKSRMILLISNFRGNIVKKKEKRMDPDDDASTFPAHLFKVSSRKFDESIERYYSNHLPSPSIRVL